MTLREEKGKNKIFTELEGKEISDSNKGRLASAHLKRIKGLKLRSSSNNRITTYFCPN